MLSLYVHTHTYSHTQNKVGKDTANQLTAITSGRVTRIKELDRDMNYQLFEFFIGRL